MNLIKMKRVGGQKGNVINLNFLLIKQQSKNKNTNNNMRAQRN